ncbi:hypothetical protein SLA2020_470280 [Shorea laevis]
MMGSLQAAFLPAWNHHRRRRQPPIKGETCVALTKQGRSFLSSLAISSGDSAIANRLIKKFVASSPKSVALNALSHLLSPRNSHSHLSSLALPLYMKITEATWFNWNSKLVADLIALLDTQGRRKESKTLISDAVSKLKLRERDLAQFYCNLVESHSKHNSKQGFDDSYARLCELVCNSSSAYVKRQGYKSMVSSLCEMGELGEAESVMEEMRMKGLKPSLFEFRSMVYGYGRLGLFEDMERMVLEMEKEGLEIDTICSNMVLSSYGAHNALYQMVPWLQRMKNLGIPFSIRTFNSVLNSCSMIMSMLQDRDAFPLSIVELNEILKGEEALLVKELAGSSVLDEAMEWDALEAKLDLHGMHLASAYLIMLQWIEEMKCKFKDEEHVVPAQMTIVCGSGKHSQDRGESPVKHLVKEMMFRLKSPMKIDRKNNGCLIAKGKVLKNWVCLLREENASFDDVYGEQS